MKHISRFFIITLLADLIAGSSSWSSLLSRYSKGFRIRKEYDPWPELMALVESNQLDRFTARLSLLKAQDKLPLGLGGYAELLHLLTASHEEGRLDFLRRLLTVTCNEDSAYILGSGLIWHVTPESLAVYEKYCRSITARDAYFLHELLREERLNGDSNTAKCRPVVEFILKMWGQRHIFLHLHLIIQGREEEIAGLTVDTETEMIGSHILIRNKKMLALAEGIPSQRFSSIVVEALAMVNDVSTWRPTCDDGTTIESQICLSPKLRSIVLPEDRFTIGINANGILHILRQGPPCLVVINKAKEDPLDVNVEQIDYPHIMQDFANPLLANDSTRSDWGDSDEPNLHYALQYSTQSVQEYSVVFLVSSGLSRTVALYDLLGCVLYISDCASEMQRLFGGLKGCLEKKCSGSNSGGGLDLIGMFHIERNAITPAPSPKGKRRGRMLDLNEERRGPFSLSESAPPSQHRESTIVSPRQVLRYRWGRSNRMTSSSSSSSDYSHSFFSNNIDEL